jgi:hypothetical protein
MEMDLTLQPLTRSRVKRPLFKEHFLIIHT